ncbi:TetR family transcriptional regulator [Actinorhabdospora filicis]|uniref:TetR family transcriptional regulator n=1 Tax=Actinorhabdospora filicis TaxID=1785913 RepID=A0A9W6SMA2_9ACTN|nr:helix-turn-helix domain-containing protein [Actinorhabdospora filicis]GLZ79544.1 TetR family transcriptional regulator [Actinorhabdospora filicis]
MSVIPGQGDAERIIRLLWRTDDDVVPTAPGPRRALSVGLIIEAAVAVADETGMAGLSMRAVGDRLGRTSMALYTYVADKAELVDLMYDHVHAELGRDRPAGPWRDRVHTWAADLTAMYLRHPWVPEVSYARAVLGPHEQAVLEDLLAALEPLALPPETLRGAAGSLHHLVRGFARTLADAERLGEPDTETWQRRADALAASAPDFAERFPLSVRLSRATGWDPDWRARIEATMRTGIDLLLDGLA